MKHFLLHAGPLSCLVVAAALGCSSESSPGGGSGGSTCNDDSSCDGSGGLTATGGGSGAAPAAGGATGSSGGAQNGDGGHSESTGGSDAASGGQDGTGGADGGGGTTAGSGGEMGFDPPFILGADISGTQESSATYVDTDGQTKSLFDLLKNHGFNYIRLRTFVDPGAPYGYSSTANGCEGKSEDYGDKAHVIAYGKKAKDAGMGFLLDFHYSDVWADPGNQIIPDAWREASSTDELASLMKAYTKDVIKSAIDAGARPDMVQVGNEITPGLMAHLPGSSTDCWGNNPGSTSPIGGSTSNWDNLATLLKAGIAGVREVDPTIKVMLHIENTDDLAGVAWWVKSATDRGVDFDVLGLSCYTKYQGEPSVWENTFTKMAEDYPDLDFAIAEYNPSRTEANMIMKNLSDGRGLGTFIWEPTQSGDWGESLFTWEGNTQVAIKSAFDEYEAMLPALGL